MCETCGCGSNEVKIYKPGEDSNKNDHSHSHSHTHSNRLSPQQQKSGRIISLEQDLFQSNNNLALKNRQFFNSNNILTLNLVSSPGSGKTTILEKTLTNRNTEDQFYIIEGDQQTDNDAERIRATGVPVIQVNTGTGCHLDAEMIMNAVDQLNIRPSGTLFIENVGNLVCPALFDLGEHHKVVIISTAEGDDKPLKYPHMFRASTLCIINKIDLLPYLDFDIEKCKLNARTVNPKIQFIETSAKTGDGFSEWSNWLKDRKL